MTVMNENTWGATRIVYLVASSVFSGFVLRSLLKITRAINTGVTNSSFSENTGMCARVFERFDAFQLSKNFSVAVVTLVFVASLSRTAHEFLFFCLCRECTVRRILWVFALVCVLLSYTITPAAHFERLRLTFEGTAMQLPKWSPKLMYGMCLLYLSLMLGGGALRYSQPGIASVLIALALVLYCVGISVLTLVFYKKTTAAAGITDTDILEVAVRSTLVVTVSMLSTVAMWLVVSLLIGLCPTGDFCLTVGSLLYTADQCLNAFCLMCTFGGAATHYQRAFGCVHSAAMAHVSKILRRRALEPHMAASITVDAVKDETHDSHSV